jgi:hypothetical protein
MRSRVTAHATNPALQAAFTRAVPGWRRRPSADSWLVAGDDGEAAPEIDEGEPDDGPD